MAIGGRPWCDFVVYTSVGINVFNPEFWHNCLLPKLKEFYDIAVDQKLLVL